MLIQTLLSTRCPVTENTSFITLASTSSLLTQESMFYKGIVLLDLPLMHLQFKWIRMV
jgi:hypothetical protein